MSHDYRAVTEWRLAGDLAEVADLLSDYASFPGWWPAVYLAVAEAEPGGPDGVGRRLEMQTKGWLPYTLRWGSVLSDPVTPDGYSFTAHGDFVGTGAWTFVQDGPEVVARLDWQISADKPLLRRLWWVFEPIFDANHRWAMARGLDSARLELRRRRAADPAALALIPDPPRATFRRTARP